MKRTMADDDSMINLPGQDCSDYRVQRGTEEQRM